jgi:mRNA interferase HigB
MTLLGKGILAAFKAGHSDAQAQLDSWEAEVEAATWKTPHELKAQYPKASILRNLQVVFDICGNRYRLWVQVMYQTGMVLVRRIGTHEEYEKWEIK